MPSIYVKINTSTTHGDTMKLSEKTIAILKNFSTINQSVALKTGSSIKTINSQKSVMAFGTTDDVFPSEACIYDLSRFLQTYGLYSSPEIEFQAKNFLITEGNKKTKYTYADAAMILQPPEKQITFPSVDVELTLKWDDIQSVMKSVNVLRLPEIAFIGENGKTYLKAINSEDKSADVFAIELGKTADTFTLIIKPENINLIQGDYKVELCSAGISKFEGPFITYYIAIEAKNKSYTKG